VPRYNVIGWAPCLGSLGVPDGRAKRMHALGHCIRENTRFANDMACIYSTNLQQHMNIKNTDTTIISRM
jgi:hypothetical protein